MNWNLNPDLVLSWIDRSTQKTLHFFATTGTREFRAEGYDPAVDITEQTIAEAKRRIAMYEALIKKIESDLT